MDRSTPSISTPGACTLPGAEAAAVIVDLVRSAAAMLAAVLALCTPPTSMALHARDAVDIGQNTGIARLF
jgi:hypothetical protein